MQSRHTIRPGEARPKQPRCEAPYVPAKDPEIPHALILYHEERTCTSCNTRAVYPLPDIVVQYQSGRRARYSARIRQTLHHLSLERRVDTIQTQTTFCPHCWHPGPATPRACHNFLLQEWDASRAKPFRHETEGASAQAKRTRMPALRALSDEEI